MVELSFFHALNQEILHDNAWIISEWAKILHALGKSKSTWGGPAFQSPHWHPSNWRLKIVDIQIYCKCTHTQDIYSFITSSEFWSYCWSGRMLRRLCSNQKSYLTQWTYIRTTYISQRGEWITHIYSQAVYGAADLGSGCCYAWLNWSPAAYVDRKLSTGQGDLVSALSLGRAADDTGVVGSLIKTWLEFPFPLLFEEES